MQQVLRSTVDKQLRGLNLIAQLQPDVALLLLTYCVNTRPSFVARNYPPEISQGYLREFDAAVDECLAKICQATDIAGAWWLRGLPVDMAGIGLTRLSEICTVAHVSCLVGALANLRTRVSMETMDVMRDSVTQGQMQLITHSLPFLVEDQKLRLPGELPRQLPQVPVDMHVLYKEEMAKVKQSSLARVLHKQNHAVLRDRLLQEEQYERAAMLQSTTPKRQMARWLKGGLFLNMHNRLSAADYLQCLRLRLMVPEYAGVNGVCGCAARIPVARGVAHLLSCHATQREQIFRHDSVRGALAKWCKKCVGVNGSVQEEVGFERRGELQASQQDIIVRTDQGEEYIVDVAVVNQLSPSYVYGTERNPLIPAKDGAAFVPGFAAEVKSVAKRSKALKELTPGELARFIPFALELTGRPGDAALGFVAEMERCHNTWICDGAPAAFRKLKA